MMENRVCCDYQLWKEQTPNDRSNFVCVSSNSNKHCDYPFESHTLKNKKSKSEKCVAPVPDYVRILMVTDVCGRKKQLQVPAALDLERPKRPRTTFTEKQLEILEREFEDNHFVSEPQRKRLSEYLGLSQTQIKVWFQNRRTKYRRMGEPHHRGAHRGDFDFEFLSTVNMKMKMGSGLDGDTKLNLPMTYGPPGPGRVPLPLVRPGQGREPGPGQVQLPLPLQLPVPLPHHHHLPVWPPPPVRVPIPFQVPIQIQAKSIT